MIGTSNYSLGSLENTMTPDELNKWLKWVHITSIPLKRLGPGGSPIGIASGCLVNYQGRRFILTVAHAVSLGSSDWVIELGNDEERGAEFYQGVRFIYPGEMNRRTGEIADVDYTFAEVPIDLESTFQHLIPFGPKSEKQRRHVFDLATVGEPNANEIYAFSGEIHPEMHASVGLVTEPTVYPGLLYIKNGSPFYQFRLPVPHPGDDFFRGCSGAPIVDTNRRLVALVSSGSKPENVIYGIALSRYRFALDFYCNKIRPA